MSVGKGVSVVRVEVIGRQAVMTNVIARATAGSNLLGSEEIALSLTEFILSFVEGFVPRNDALLKVL
jgi:hypothetical protein